MRITFMLMILMLLAGFAVAALRKRKTSDDQDWPVVSALVLSKAEQVMYHRLTKAFPDQRILAQVAPSQFVHVRKGATFGKLFNRYHRLTADFVICTPDFRALAVFELDDSSHDRPARLEQDQRKAAVLNAAGIPLNRLNVNPMPNEVELRDLLAK
jgi:hypothetical protein